MSRHSRRLPGGDVLQRENHYEGGADALAIGLHKALEGYIPANNPDLTNGVLEGLKKIPGRALALGRCG